jgi:hypothetical protein
MHATQKMLTLQHLYIMMDGFSELQIMMDDFMKQSVLNE